MSTWYIEGYFETTETINQLPIGELPQTLGRDDALSCYIPSSSVSRRHAGLDIREGQLYINDLNSRNGTFVNRHRIDTPTKLVHGDVIHLGKVEMRLINRRHTLSMVNALEEKPETTQIIRKELSKRFPFGVRELEELIHKQAVEMLFQPIVNPHDGIQYGFEILGRGRSPDLPSSPLNLFEIAESVGLDITLSELMRNTGVAVAVQNQIPGYMLINTHPRELNFPDQLLRSLTSLRRQYPDQAMMLEIHEKSLTNIGELKLIKRDLLKMDILFAFDDFGVGQSRLMDMIEAKPDLIKFDRAMISDIDKADASRLSLLRSLKELTNALNIRTLAECVSSEGEYRVCQSMDFDLYQGYLFGKPMSVTQLAA